jgi:hypothetical protein
MMHLLILGIVALAMLIAGFVVGMCITAKRADEAMAEAIQDCTRPAPHVCKLNGPCNGYPKEKL